AKWTLLLLETAEKNSSSIELVSHLLHKCSFPEHKEIFILLLAFILDGKIKLKRVRKWEHDMQDSIELEETSRLPVPVFSFVQRIWDERMKPYIAYFAAPIMVMGLEKMQMLFLRQAALEKKDGVPYNTVEFSEHDLQPKDFTFLIRVVKECLTYLCENDKSKANYYIAQMIETDSILQNRIAIAAMSENSFVTDDEKVKWLVEKKLLLHVTYRHEVFAFLKSHYSFASEQSKQEVLQKVMKHVVNERAFDACLVMDLLYTCDPDSSCTAEAYKKMKQKHPHFSPKRYGEKQVEDAVQSITCNVTADGLLQLKDDEMMKQVRIFSHDGIFEQRHFLEMLSKACKLNTEWSISLAYQLAGESKVSNEVWFVCIRAWKNNRKLTNQQIQKIIPLLQQFVRNPSFHWLISSFLYEISNRLEEFQEDSIRIMKRFAISIFPQVMKNDLNFKVEEQDFYNESIQHPIGKMTSVLLKLLAYDHLYDRNIHEYLFLFEEQLRICSQNANFMLARLTADITFLYHIEKQWCRKNLLSYLDLKQQGKAIEYVWAGLCYTQINLPLFTEIKRYIKYAAQHLHLLHPHTKEVFLKWLSFVFIKCVLYWEQRAEWLYPLFIQETENDKIKFMEHLSYYVKTLSMREQQKFWEDWLAGFLIERPKMSSITGREYVMFLRFVLCMDEMVEKGLQTILTHFLPPSEYYNQAEMKLLFVSILEKKKNMRGHVEIYGELFFSLLQHLHEANSFEHEIIEIKQLLTEHKLENSLLVSIQNEMIRIGLVMANLQDG
ncbi:hypothetical protein COK19_24365, partial [Bacillus cereus]|uniref:DUF4020 domain-containing protein n=1 Tax=Bacillus cereus TaxID=1396 RepID=UPI000BF9B62C